MRRTIRNTLISTLAMAGLAACQAFAQQYDHPSGDRDYARQDRSLFDRARADLDRASNYQYSSRADRKRFDEARRDLFDFAARFEQGRYEKHELDHAIDRVENVVSHNSLNPRDRGALDEDLRRMRDYRNFRDRKEYRDYNSGRR